MSYENLINSLTLEEKARLITGISSMCTYPIARLDIKSHEFADGPHGVRSNSSNIYTLFPNLCCIGASWDTDMIEKMGEALADDCIAGGISMLLAPGINIKRHPVCGRNFEYISEDPIVSGEMGAAYINGLQKKGVSACLKHFAVNNQEADRLSASFEVDIRTLMEIYLKGFEIAIKKSNPKSVMCAYNKLYSVWCSENRFLLTEVLRDSWGYEGFVISDWGAVSDICKAVSAGLDLEMPNNDNITEQIEKGIKSGALSIADLDRAVTNVLKFVTNKPLPKKASDRGLQHQIARELAASGITLLKNNDMTLPLTKEKYKKIAVVGEFAKDALICGQGSAEVHADKKYIDSPLSELESIVGGDIEIKYMEFYKKREFSGEMLWPKTGELFEFAKDCDAILVFAGAMESEDTENFDRRTLQLNPNYEMAIRTLLQTGKKVILILQSGSAMILGNYHKSLSAIVQMWLGGEGAGRAIAEILTGIKNPSGKLTETFPNKMPTHLNYPGDGVKLSYDEKFNIGYRYYDNHSDEVLFPFGHGLSYTSFEYSNMALSVDNDVISVSADITNTGEVFGSEVVQLYVSKKGGTTAVPQKELKAFTKLHLNSGETKKAEFILTLKDIANYNPLLKEWITEPCDYEFIIAASCADIRLCKTIYIEGNAPYSTGAECKSMIG